ncbi:MAG: hypothetical protein QOH69_1778 [Actinomycetota bacterium]|jgi:hypothetical protein|nr:hypothetical protein [Actinomycetota bacterium]
MGRLIYGPTGTQVDIEDRTLAHLKVVILTKLRRGEGFAFSWERGTARGGGRDTMWLNPAIGLEFQFDGGREASLNKVWLDELMASANSGGGLHILPEHDRGPANDVPTIY